MLQVLFSMWVFTDTSGLKGWANAHKKPLYHQHLYVNVASGEILPKKGCEECSPPNGMKQKIGFHPWVGGKILCKIAESEFPPKKLRELFLLITPFFNWFPIIFADEITALPARKLDLAIGVSVGSSTQIALFVVPVARRILLVLSEVQIEVGGPLNELWEDFSLQTAFFSCGKVSIFAASSVGIWNGVFW